ncbi:hypothetical protein C4585_01610 [Candidatus Parcubacteria bacterium]|nr:MAG: hypothetical protein C4585_01610 [Candidatus Parcubacteria bacterium]
MSEKASHLYGEIECKLINLMLRFPDVVGEMLNNGITPMFFEPKRRNLVLAIFQQHGLSDGKRSLTDDHYRTILLEQGVKGDITIAMQVYHDCMYGAPSNNSKDDFDLLKKELISAYVHREGVEALHRMNENVPKMGYVEATKLYSNALQEITDSVDPKANDVPLARTASDCYNPDYFVNWLWQGRIARRELNVVAGKPGQGKSLTSLDIAARLSMGKPMPFESAACKPVKSAIFCPEEDLQLCASRLQVAGARMDFVKPYTTSNVTVNQIKRLIAEHDVGFIVFDPITQFGKDIDGNNEIHVRQFLMPLREIAATHNVAILAIQHLNKEFKNSDMLERLLGSVAWGALPRVVSGVLRENDQQYLVSAKNCLGPKVRGMPYQIVEVKPSPKQSFPKLEWGTEFVDIDATIITGNEDSALDEAQDFLSERLNAKAGFAKDIIKDAQSQGICRATIYRAAKRMQVKKDNGIWHIPAAAAP